MTLEEGTFQIYSRIKPPLTAGDWRLDVDQDLGGIKDGDTLDSSDLSVETGKIHFTVRSPRYLLPPDQVLSTFPPANATGAFGSRLPQVVIKRRTLPWERAVAPPDELAPVGTPTDTGPVKPTENTPWLALVLIAEGEAEFKANTAVDQCFTPLITLPTGDTEPAEVAVGNHLRIRQSMVHRIFPTREDVELLAHARAVDINDTELMMGDDDGYLSVVVSNRLPLGGRDADGNEVPVKYLACLVNLEGQFNSLLNRSPDPLEVTPQVAVHQVAYTHYAQTDHATMETAAVDRALVAGIDTELSLATTDPAHTGTDGDGDADTTDDGDAAPAGLAATEVLVSHFAPDQASTANSVMSDWTEADAPAEDVYAKMARPWTGGAGYHAEFLDPMLRFPVLLHWSFTTFSNKTFKELMTELSSGLLGDVDPPRPDAASTSAVGRLPLEVTETGHVGLEHKTREGDSVRSWYRGPLLPHPPPPVGSEPRLALAHSSDQLRIVVPDGKEDLSLATAFEIGRLLALSRPSIIAALMRWRADRFVTARRRNLLDQVRDLMEDITGARPELVVEDPFVQELVFELMNGIGRRPEVVFGSPRPATTPGVPLELDDDPMTVLEMGLGLDRGVLSQPSEAVIDRLARTETVAEPFRIEDLGTVQLRDNLQVGLGDRLLELTAEVNDIEVFPTDRLDQAWTGGLVAGQDFNVRNRLSSVQVDGPILDGPILDGPVVDGPVVDGPVVDGPILRGPAVDGPVVDRPPDINRPDRPNRPNRPPGRNRRGRDDDGSDQ